MTAVSVVVITDDVVGRNYPHVRIDIHANFNIVL